MTSSLGTSSLIKTHEEMDYEPNVTVYTMPSHWCAELYFDKRSKHSGGCVDDRMYAPLSHPVVQAEHRTEAAKQLRRSNLNHGKAEHLHAIKYKEETAALGGLSTPSLSCTKSGGWTMNPMSRCPPSHWCDWRNAPQHVTGGTQCLALQTQSVCARFHVMSQKPCRR